MPKSSRNAEEGEEMELEPNGDTEDLPYDPDQNREERREIRKGYRQLQEDESLQNPNDVGIDRLTEQVQTANVLFKRVKGPQEATLDSAFLLQASGLGAAKARQMKSGSGTFDIDDLVAKLITFMGGRKHADERPENAGSDDEIDDDGDAPLEWEKIGRKALAKSRRVPAMDFMLGPLSIEQKKRASVKRAKLEKDKGEERKPQELKEDDIQRSENETTKNVVALQNMLDEIGGSINLFKFVVNPESFGQTVENIFYLSFLIRDGVCALEFNEENEPMIFLTERPTDEDYQQGLKKRQMVMEMDQETWKRAIEVFEIKKSHIPTRKAAQTKLGNKWYG
ncbi:hypothetical protein BD410DRAFT_764462 [Rickenella mellea]|uniref:Non-structural maintenance of chromosomes element 4 n=1 Tax=Rickenella mellea TaxID=50990 RepID=A0A4Y7QFT9_9AGAM|nr:hypothetical protein BD410DRAFT_764462 [Rickenella mellea]